MSGGRRLDRQAACYLTCVRVDAVTAVRAIHALPCAQRVAASTAACRVASTSSRVAPRYLQSPPPVVPGKRSSGGSFGWRISGCCAIPIRPRRSSCGLRRERNRRSSRRRSHRISFVCSSDPEARVRRRAALAVGRVGLAAGVEPLTRLLTRRRVRSAADGGICAGADRPMPLRVLRC